MAGHKDPSRIQGSCSLTFVCAPHRGHRWAKLSHKEGTSRDRLETGSREVEGTEVRTVTFSVLAARWLAVCGWPQTVDELKGWACSENLKEQT